MFEALRPFIISFAIGFILGIERERSHPAGMQAMGVRTFILFALLGTLAAEIHKPLFTIVLALFVFAVILMSYFRSTDNRVHKLDIGITTEVAGAMVFCMGYLAAFKPLLASLLALGVLLVLLGRKRLHKFARNKIKPKEMQATVTLLVIALGVISFLPNYTIDPWGLFNPRKFGILVMILALMQFGGYLAIRVFGQRLGMVLGGFFGGIVSSTAVFATLPKFSRQSPELCEAAVTAAIYAIIATLLEFVVIVLVAAPKLMLNTLLPVLAMTAVGFFMTLFMLRKTNHNEILTDTPNPLDVLSVFRLALFIGGMIVLVALARRFLGVHGMQLVSFTGALFELHAVSLATATLYASNKLGLGEAELNLALAVLATFVSKFILLWTLARNRFAVITSAIMLLMLAAGVSVYLLV